MKTEKPLYGSAEVVDLIEEFLRRETEFERFKEEILKCILDGEPDGSVTDQDGRFFRLVLEKLKKTTDKLDKGEAELGWVYHVGFRGWLRWQYGLHQGRPDTGPFNPWS